MTDIWNTLWGFWDAGKVDPFALETCFPDFIKKIRAEGDSLQSELQRYKNSFHLIKLAGGKEVELASKLEAVKDWMKTYPASQNVRGTITRSDLQDWKNHGLRILGETADKVEK